MLKTILKLMSFMKKSTYQFKLQTDSFGCFGFPKSQIESIVEVLTGFTEFSQSGLPNLKINRLDGFYWFIGHNHLVNEPDFELLDIFENYKVYGTFQDLANKTIYLFENCETWHTNNFSEQLTLPLDVRGEKRVIHNRLVMIKPKHIINEDENGFKRIYVDRFSIVGKFEKI